MRKSFVIVLGDHKGAFLEVDRIFSELGLDIVRVSYNKVVDVHTCFVEAEGPERALTAAADRIRELGLFPSQNHVGTVHLVEFEMRNRPGVLRPTLELIDQFDFNITYVDARVIDEGLPEAVQRVQMGLYVEDERRLEDFVSLSNEICPTRLVPYDKTTRILDNNLFYIAFAREMRERFDLGDDEEHLIMVNANRIIQNLEHTNSDPYRPFDYLRQFANAVAGNRGDAYRENTRVSEFATAGGVRGVLIEPPCGSNTWVFDCDECLLAIDTGYACYREEILSVLRERFPDWDERRRELFLTHGDVDHVGCCDLFDRVWAVGRTMDTFRMQLMGEPDWRARNHMHEPYLQITNLATSYRPPWLSNFTCLGRRDEAADALIAPTLDTSTREPAYLDVPPFHFEVWEGAGGHVKGETVLIDRVQRVCVSGDIFINIHGQTRSQRDFNLLAPFLMTSVDSVPDLERAERKFLFTLLDPGEWQILGGHGALLEYTRKD